MTKAGCFAAPDGACRAPIGTSGLRHAEAIGLETGTAREAAPSAPANGQAKPAIEGVAA